MKNNLSSYIGLATGFEPVTVKTPPEVKEVNGIAVSKDSGNVYLIVSQEGLILNTSANARSN